MATTEHSINDVIAELLRGTRFAWRGDGVVLSETTGLLADSAGMRPDIMILEPYTAPVVIESEVLPAQTVEEEAVARLGEKLARSGKSVLSAIALRLPPRLRDYQGQALREAVRCAKDLEFAHLSGRTREKLTRYPDSGWLDGGIHELSILAQSAMMPPVLVDEAATILEVGVSNAAAHLDQIASTHTGMVLNIADELHQQDSQQTRRMAVTILANALMFHEVLVGGPGELRHVRPIQSCTIGNNEIDQNCLAMEWRKILQVNYWPIFDIALRILFCIPPAFSGTLFAIIANTARRLANSHLLRSHDMTGTVFQRLIADRKFLAAYYTTPASAALLAGLAISEDSLLNDSQWADDERVKSLQIADFSCGTGTLLSTAYKRVSQLHELHGGDAAAIHPQMIENALLGCDILPAAAHLTASMLSGAHPTVQYRGGRIFTLRYGRQENDTVALGSIDLLRDMALLQGSEITARALEGEGAADENAWRYAPHVSFDLVIMNPPFTRATNHEGRHENVPNPMFAAFGSSAEEQKAMSNAAKRLTGGTIAHGNAGEASIFLALADRKLAKDGMLAMVMPLTLLTGTSWEKCRARLAESYEGLILVSIAGSHSKSMAFSADTGMADCLVIGKRNGKRQTRATFVVLEKAPENAAFSGVVAQRIRQLIEGKAIRRLEGSPVGGTHITLGGELVGQALDVPLPRSGSWKVARIADFSLAQTAHHLSDLGQIWLPTQERPADIVMTTVANAGEIGPIHRDITGTNPDGSIRGPFERRQIPKGAYTTYPMLWAHKAERERTLQFEADCEGVPRHVQSQDEQQLIDEKAQRIFKTASHCHSNLDFQFNAQSTAIQFTERKTIGGTAWISIQLEVVEQEKALVVWGNTLLGLLMFWWHSSKQQAARGRLTKTTLATLPVLDVSALTPAQLASAARIFDDTCQLPLKPLHELHLDDNRKLLDRRFYGEVLNLPDSLLRDNGPLDILRVKLAQEPSIRGSKPAPDSPSQ